MCPQPLHSITQGDVYQELRRGGVSLTETAHGAGTILTEHAHRCAALSLVLTGHFEERVGDEWFHCGPMSLLYKPPDAPHSNRYGPSGARTLLAALDAPTFRRLARLLPGSEGGAIQVTGPIAARALSLYATGHGQSAEPALDWEELFAEILDRAAARRDGVGRRPPWLDRVEESIRERFAEPIRLSLLAEEAGVHPVHLARVYRYHHRCSVGDALRRRRVEHAVARLRSGPVDIAQLALDCGFADQSHFTRAFGREIGVPPGQFRRRVLGLPDGRGPGPLAP